MNWFRRLSGRASVDPGEAWTVEMLAPLRRLEISCDVAPAVMRRVAHERPALGLSGSLRAPRLAWASSLVLALGTLALLVATLVTMVAVGDAGVETLWKMAASVAGFAGLVVQFVGVLVITCIDACATLMRGVWIILVAAAPLVRSAGLLAATCGAVSILVSTYIFVHARRVAPVTCLEHGTFQGGS